MTTPAAGSLAAILADISTFLTSVLSWIGSVIDFVVGEPILMVFVMFVLVKIAMRVCRRWIPGL